MKIMKVVECCVFVMFGAVAMAQTPYGFDTMSTGLLSGQDQWMAVPGYGTSMTVNGSGLGSDTTNVLVASDFSVASRLSDAGLAASSNTSFLRLQIDYSTLTPNNSDGFWFGVGVDANHDGKIDPDTEMTLGISEYLTGMFLTRKGDGSTIPAGLPYNGIDAGQDSTLGDAGDWIRLRADFDFTGGAGSYVLSYENLTAGQGSFTVLKSGALGANILGIDPTQFDGVFLSLNAGSAVDNLVTASSPVPEPADYAILMAAGSVLGALVYRRRRAC